MPRYMQVWFKCDVIDCEARTEELVEIPDGRSAEAALRSRVPAGWFSSELNGLVLYDALVCAACNERLLELSKQRREASGEARYGVSMMIMMLFPEERRLYLPTPSPTSASLPWAQRCGRPLSYDGYSHERCTLPVGHTSSCSSSLVSPSR